MDRNILIEIKASFRQSMNADIADSMRRQGVQYRINFGVPAPRIGVIASRFEKDEALATHLWNENVRESKILATYLFPSEQMTLQKAQEWIAQIPYTEIADQLCMNLLSKERYALDIALLSITSESRMICYTGFRLLTRLWSAKEYPTREQLLLIVQQAERVIKSDTATLSVIALNLLERICEEETEFSNLILKYFVAWQNSNDEIEQRVFERLSDCI